MPLPPPGDLPDPGTESMALISPALGGGFFTTSTTWAALCLYITQPQKQDEILSFVTAGVDPEGVMVSGIRQREKCCAIPIMCAS